MKSFTLMLIAIILVVVVSPIAIVFNTIRHLYRRENISDYFFTIAIGFDQAGGSILYKQEDWTVSSWTYNLCRRGNKNACVFMKVIDSIFGKNHCQNSFEWENQLQQKGKE